MGAARQAAWALTGSLPDWQAAGTRRHEAEHRPSIRECYQEVADRVAH
jgi:xylulokinase